MTEEGTRGTPGFGTRLKELRLAKNLTQKQLAARCGLTHAQVSHIELGRSRPSIDSAARLARALDVSVDELVGAVPLDRAELSLSSLPLRRWLRGNGFKYCLMSPVEFGEHLVDQDPLIDETGQSQLLVAIGREISEEKEHVKKALGKASNRGELGEIMTDPSPYRRAGAVGTFVKTTLRDHYRNLGNIMIQFSTELAAQREAEGLPWDALAPDERHARMWREQAMDAAISRIVQEDQVRT
jgi:transcriptional regulator with XRE-family HTH domain